MHTLPSEIGDRIGTSTTFAAWNAVIYVNQIEDERLDPVIDRRLLPAGDAATSCTSTAACGSTTRRSSSRGCTDAGALSSSPMPDVLRPLFDQVVIKELEPDRMRKSGLLVPQGTHDVPPNEGIVLAAGEGPPDLPDFRMPVKPGDHVVFPRSAGVWVEVEDERLLVCRVREILGVIETAPAQQES